MKRAKATLLLAMTLFAAVQMATNAAIESDALPVRDPLYSEKLALLQTHPEFWQAESAHPRVLALGSSRTQMLIDAERLGPEFAGFNFGCASCGPIAQLLYLLRLLDAGMRAEVVLLEVHPAFLADLAEPFEMRWLHPHRLRAREGEYLRGLGIAVESPVHSLWLQSTSNYRPAILGEYAPDWLPSGRAIRRPVCDRFGSVEGIDPSPALRAELAARARSEYAPAFADYRPGGPAVDALRRIVEHCRQHGIKPVLFVTPESSEFRSRYGDAGNVRFAEFVNTLRGDVLNSREALPDCDFADGHHATPRGRRAFTDLVRAHLRGKP